MVSYGQMVGTMALLIMANYELSYGGKVKLMLDVSLFISRGCLPVISLDEVIEYVNWSPLI